jgi:hypothetical protein
MILGISHAKLLNLKAKVQYFIDYLILMDNDLS